MKCIWLGQAGLLFDFDGVKVMVDPYLSNSVADINPQNQRRIEVDRSFFDIRPDVMILTHDHLDHTDPETLEVFFERYEEICVLASQNAWKRVRNFGKSHNYVMFDRGTEWTQYNIHFRAVHAQHSDDHAIGVCITYKEETWYVAGDTLYHDLVIRDVKATGQEIQAVFLPINGVGNNMNLVDASRFANKIQAKKVVPIHFGMFDDIIPEREFACQNIVVPEIYKEISIIDRED